MFCMKGKRVLITGASGGIGAEIAVKLSELGSEISLSATRVEKLNELSQKLQTKVHVIPCDLNNNVEVNDLIQKAEDAMGGLDILINNAGLTRDGLAIRMKDQDWEDVLNVNLYSAFKLSRACLKNMMKQRKGRIINITSVVGVTGNPGQANYCASKAGIIGMSKSLAAEVASRGITINCVAPGFIDTPMTDKLNEKQKEAINATIPLGRMGYPEEIASAVVFLASDEAAYITGQTLHVNGGMAMI